MNFSTLKPCAKSLSFTSDTMTVQLLDGRTLTVPLLFFPRLKDAPFDKLQRYEISGGGTGLHWDDLDEDISVPLLMTGHVSCEAEPLQEAA